ncbi:unnamed protein product [Prunus armeniaca]
MANMASLPIAQRSLMQLQILQMSKTPPFCATTTSSSTTPWILDSGATEHIAPPCGLCTPLNSRV